MTSESPPIPGLGWRTPRVVIVAGCLVLLLAFGVRASFGLFMGPISHDLGWGREVFAMSLALQNLIWGLSQPFAGAIADRYGTARVLVAGGLVYGLGTYLMAVAGTPGAMHLSAGLLIGLGLSGTSFGVVLAAIGRMVSEERRSWALGLGTAAGSLGQFTLVPLGQQFLAAHGWSVALMLLALLSLLVIPLSTALAGRGAVVQRGARQTMGEALVEAGTHSGFIYLSLGFFVCGFQVAFIAAHLPAYVTDLGLPLEIGGWAIALVGLFNVVGSYTAGVLGGRYSKKYLLSGLYVTRSLVIAVFVLAPPSAVSVLVFASVMGLLWLSTVPLTSGLVAQFFGVRYLATLFGIVFLSHQLGSFLGVWLGGRLYDATGSYDIVWWISVALGLGAAALHWPIDERPVPRLAEAG